jgi:hypothetical protein
VAQPFQMVEIAKFCCGGPARWSSLPSFALGVLPNSRVCHLDISQVSCKRQGQVQYSTFHANIWGILIGEKAGISAQMFLESCTYIREQLAQEYPVQINPG